MDNGWSIMSKNLSNTKIYHLSDYIFKYNITQISLLYFISLLYIISLLYFYIVKQVSKCRKYVAQNCQKQDFLNDWNQFPTNLPILARSKLRYLSCVIVQQTGSTLGCQRSQKLRAKNRCKKFIMAKITSRFRISKKQIFVENTVKSKFHILLKNYEFFLIKCEKRYVSNQQDNKVKILGFTIWHPRLN